MVHLPGGLVKRTLPADRGPRAQPPENIPNEGPHEAVSVAGLSMRFFTDIAPIRR